MEKYSFDDILLNFVRNGWSISELKGLVSIRKIQNNYVIQQINKKFYLELPDNATQYDLIY